MSIPAPPSSRVLSPAGSGRPAPPIPSGDAAAAPGAVVSPNRADLLVPCPARYSAAWIPADDAERPWDPTPVAVRWLLEQAEHQRLKPVLLRGRPMTGRLPPALRYLERRAARELRRPAPGRAVLVYLPDLATAARAFRAALGGAVVVVEAPDLPLATWAAETGALNLVSGSIEAALPEATADGLRRMLGSADGGWLAPEEAGLALQESDVTLSADAVTGYLLAHGCGARTVRQLVAPAREPCSRSAPVGR